MFYVVTAVLNLVAPFFTAPALITLTEALPKSVRSGVLATLYAVAISTFGGTTQVTVKYLTDLTGSPLAPAWYLTGALIVGAVAMLLVRETAPVRTG
jgi:hypothetical protein